MKTPAERLVKTSELTGPALDWAVAKAEGVKSTWHRGRFVTNFDLDPRSGGPFFDYYQPSTNPAQAWPIIEREKLCPIWCEELQQWGGNKKVANRFYFAQGPSFLIAAMRCYVAFKIGDTVEVPEELLP